MTETFPIIAGIIAAMAHVVSGPDHLAAVAPFAVESKSRAWKIGITWGLGHLSGMLAIGLLMSLFKDLLPLTSISTHSELLVGYVLIGVGMWVMYKMLAEKYHLRQPHFHIFKHRHDQKGKMMASFSIGSLHGLAGVAHFIMFLPVLGFENRFQSVTYIIGFAIGTIIAMTLFSQILGHFSKRYENMRWASANSLNHLRLLTGLIAVIVGCFWIFQN
ncbi:urease accessory protein UreH domain-containing protein [Robertkochia aurantiaca]|uniref:urease accessory protein UreH domain-containing protein n=1 Tax=Robertkochia aurantiaca TaxID=2873700 RepID=UPI001CCAAF32|nr:sulfite exporter TauE/SafE family protein [Robertkochia sp. 3YJGBD-33]